MAEIFLAKMQGYSGFEKLIALKKILPRYSQNRTFAQMLIHEAKLAAALQHFNVVQVLDLGEIDRQVFIAMEYVRGRDLAAVLSNTYRRKERLPLNLVLCIATEFMTGLDYAHRMRNQDGVPLGIIHRDISPQNILISYEGEVKVTDFGIARVIAEKEGFQLPGNLHGKFGYMSPEQVMGQEIDQRSDVFSSGVVLYEMLTGQRLFRGKEHKETIKMIVSHVIPPPSTINPEVPPSVDRICAKALARDRNMRYQTMGALLGELSRVADTLPRRAATRDLSVYMRRQFGNIAAGGFAPAKSMSGRSGTDSGSSVNSSESGFHQSTGLSELSGLAIAGGTRVPLGQILIEQGSISIQDLEIALAEQRARGGRIGELLIASGNLSEDDLLRALSSQSGLPAISEVDLLSLPAPLKLLKRFPREAAEATMMLPISVNEAERSVRLAVSDPYDDRAILETKVVLGLNDVVVFLAKRSSIRKALFKWYGEDTDNLPAPPEEPIFAEAPTAEEMTVGRPLVLVADGDQQSIEALVARVHEEDCDVIVVNDGKGARQVCREQKPSVAILDAGLPGIDGYNILLELRSKNSEAAVFITSSRGDEERQAKALELGADDFIVKPFSLELTTSKIRREIKKRSGGKRQIAPPVNFSGISGSLKDMTALDIVQMLELGKKSAHVVVQYTDGRNGQMNVKVGDLRGCVCGELLGEESFYLLVRPGDGLFRIEYRPSTTPENITKPNTFLMIEAMRRLDESEKDRGSTKKSSGERRALDVSVLSTATPSNGVQLPVFTPSPKVYPPPKGRSTVPTIDIQPPVEAASFQTRGATSTSHPSFEEDSHVPQPEPRHIDRPDNLPSPPQRPSAMPARTLPSDYVPEGERSGSDPSVADQYLEPSTVSNARVPRELQPPSPREDLVRSGVMPPVQRTRSAPIPAPSRSNPDVMSAPLAAKPIPQAPSSTSAEWSDTASAWDDSLFAWPGVPGSKDRPRPPHTPPPLPPPPNPSAPAPDFASLTGDLVVDQPRRRTRSAPVEIPESPGKIDTGFESDDSEAPTRIGRVSLRRMASIHEHVEGDVVDPASEGGKRRKKK
jgi:serine/threonine protein kinase/CheY-like chemotaxis protein